MSRLGGGVRFRVGITKKDQKEIIGTTKPLMAILEQETWLIAKLACCINCSYF